MKSTFKLYGILVLITAIGFSMAACDLRIGVPGNGNDNTNTQPDDTDTNTQSYDPPQNIRLSRNGSSVTLYWSDIQGAYSYEIYYGLSQDNLSFYIERSYPTLSYSFNSLAIERKYYFAVKAKYPTGTSGFSQIVSCFIFPSETTTLRTSRLWLWRGRGRWAG